MAERDWFAEEVQVHEEGLEEYFAENIQFNEDQAVDPVASANKPRVTIKTVNH